jgi:hypothetical protein
MEHTATSDLGDDVASPMPDELALAIARQVEALRTLRPEVPLLSIFDEVMEGRRGLTIEFGDLLDLGFDGEFVHLVMEAFSPQTEMQKQLAQSDDPDDQACAAEMDEFRDAMAAAACLRRYELNGHLGRERWSSAFAGEMLRIGLVAERDMALARGRAMWDQGLAPRDPVAAADELARVATTQLH